MTTEIGLVLQSATDPAAEARELEADGYDFACMGEHVSFNVPVANSFISLAVAAGATTAIGLMSTVVLAPLYPPALLAKLAASLHVASGGRYRMGVGIGGENPAEFDACGVPVRERGARTNEALEIVRLLWSTDRATFEGRFNRFAEVTIAPRADPPPPIWVSGRSEAAMVRAARFGDGWLPYMYTPEKLASSLEVIAAHREQPDPVQPGLFIWGAVHEDAATAERYAIDALSKTYAQDFSKLVGRYAFAGTPDDVAARLGEFLDAGVTTLACSFACPGPAIAETRRLFTAEVLPRLRARG
ncbi:MAG: LLM class flavin-dependent oxidoreductase [Acidimicrobiales bacterium]